MNFVLDPLKASSSCRFPPPLPRFSFTLASFFGFLTYNSRFSFFFFFFASACFKRWNESVPSTERRERKGWKAQKRLNRIWSSRSRHPRMKSAPGLNAHSVTHNEPILDLWERQRETLPFIPRIVSTIIIAYIYICTRMINRLIWIEARADIPPPFSWITLIHGLITRRLILFRPMVYEYSASVTKRGKAGGRGRK